MFDRLKELNLKYQANFGKGLMDDDNVFEFKDRHSAIVLSAPHATQTWAKQAVKKSDLYTGALTEYLAEELGFSSLIRQKFVPEKINICDYITHLGLDNLFFLDIHGVAADKVFELGVGTGKLSASDYAAEIALLQKLAEKYQIKIVINHPDYRGLCGLTKELQDIHNRPQILQLEWRLDMRNFFAYPDNVFQRTIPFMLALVTKLNELAATR